MKPLLIPLILWSLHFSNAQAGEVQFGTLDSFKSGCVTFKSGDIKKGQHFNILSFNPNQIFQGTIVGKNNEPCRGYTNGTSYEVSLQQNSPIIIGIAVIASHPKFSIKDNIILTLKDQSIITLNQCLGMEGVNFWAMQSSKEIWRSYYYLGYDIEPNCK